MLLSRETRLLPEEEKERRVRQTHEYNHKKKGGRGGKKGMQ